MGWREPGRKAADDYNSGWSAEREIPELAGRCCAVRPGDELQGSVFQNDAPEALQELLELIMNGCRETAILIGWSFFMAMALCVRSGKEEGIL